MLSIIFQPTLDVLTYLHSFLFLIDSLMCVLLLRSFSHDPFTNTRSFGITKYTSTNTKPKLILINPGTNSRISGTA